MSNTHENRRHDISYSPLDLDQDTDESEHSPSTDLGPSSFNDNYVNFLQNSSNFLNSNRNYVNNNVATRDMPILRFLTEKSTSLTTKTS